MKEIYKMAGHFAAHAMWSVSDGETLIPILGSLNKNDETIMRRLAFDDSEAAMKEGNNALERNDGDSKGIVFISDGYLNINEAKTDALIVKIRGFDQYNTKCTLALPYRPASHEKGFGVHRPKLLEYPQDTGDRDDNLNSFFEGLESHEQACRVWKENYMDTSDSASNKSDPGHQFTSDEWDLIVQAPYLVFLTVAAADGNIDKKEIKGLTKVLIKAKEQPSPLLQKILVDSASDARSIINAIVHSGQNTIDTLEKIQDLVDTKLSYEDATVFKVSLMFIAQQIAEASGGFLGFGKKIGKEEKIALAIILKVLKIETP
jgi:hypothetical protein